MMRRPTPGCRAQLERLSRYVDGDLPPRARHDTVLHLRHCPCCHDLVDSLRKTVSLCHTEGRRRLPAAVRDRARARVTELLTPERPSKRRSR